MNGNASLRSQALLQHYQSRLQARRERLVRLLDRKPATKMQEYRRQAFVQGALHSVEARTRWVEAYKDHLQTLFNVLTGADSNPSDSRAAGGGAKEREQRGDLGEF
jgi:hypothetical protein